MKTLEKANSVPDVLEAVVTVIDRQTKLLSQVLKQVPLYHQYDLIEDTELAEDFDENDEFIPHQKSITQSKKLN